MKRETSKNNFSIFNAQPHRMKYRFSSKTGWRANPAIRGEHTFEIPKSGHTGRIG